MSPRRNPLEQIALGSLAVGLVLAATLGPGTAGDAHAVDPVTYAVGRAVTRFLLGTLPHRARDYQEINKNKNADLAEVANQQTIRQYQSDRGWLGGDAAAQEQQRLDSLRQGIIDRAEREKRITKYDYDRAIGREARTAVQGVITSLPGIDPTAAKFVSNVIGGADPLSAAAGALNDPSKPVTDRLAIVKAQLAETQAAFTSLRDRLRDPNSLLKREVDRLKDEAFILSDPRSQPAPGELEQRVNKLQQELAQTRDAIEGAWRDLTGSDVKINKERFARDDTWLGLNADVQALKDTSDATKAVIAAAMIRDRQEGTEENVRELLRNAGLPTGEETVKRMAAESISESLKAQI